MLSGLGFGQEVGGRGLGASQPRWPDEVGGVPDVRLALHGQSQEAVGAE